MQVLRPTLTPNAAKTAAFAKLFGGTTLKPNEPLQDNVTVTTNSDGTVDIRIVLTVSYTSGESGVSRGRALEYASYIENEFNSTYDKGRINVRVDVVVVGNEGVLDNCLQSNELRCGCDLLTSSPPGKSTVWSPR